MTYYDADEARYDDQPSESDLAEERFHAEIGTCRREGHVFSTSWVTNEPVGSCHRCGCSPEYAESEDESLPDEPGDQIPESLLIQDEFTRDKQGLIDWGLATPETFGLRTV